MSQSLAGDFPIDPLVTSGDELADILNRFQQSVISNNSGAAAPTDTLPGTLWLDTSGAAPVLKIRNADNSGWDTIRTSSTTGPVLFPDGALAAPSIAFASEPGLGWYRPAAGQIYMAVGGANKFQFRTGGSTTFNLLAPTGSGNGVNGYINGLQRWSIALGDGAVESSGNVGSNFAITRYSDAGAAINPSLLIDRATNSITTYGLFTGGGNIQSTNGHVMARGSVGGGNGDGFSFISYAYGQTNRPASFLASQPAAGMMAVIGAVDGSSSQAAYFKFLADTRCQNSKNVSGWDVISDRRAKTDIEDYTYGLDAVVALRPRTFKMKDSGHAQIGIIADEAETALPPLIYRGKGEVDGEVVDDFAGMQIDPLHWAMVNAIKELTARVVQLETA